MVSHTPTELTLADSIYESLQAAIVLGDLRPGERLKEPELAQRYGTSRGPLREAILRLEAHKLARVTPRSGARVTSLSMEQLLDIYQTREVLEGMACRLACVNMADSEISELQELLNRHSLGIEQQQGRQYFYQEYDLDFHYLIAKGSGNAIIAQILCEDLYHLMRMYRYKFSRIRGRAYRALKEHRRIADAIAERDGELAEFLMRRHIRAAGENIRRSSDPSSDGADSKAHQKRR